MDSMRMRGLNSGMNAGVPKKQRTVEGKIMRSLLVESRVRTWGRRVDKVFEGGVWPVGDGED